MLNRPTRSGLLVLATVALAYACDNTSPIPKVSGDAGSAGAGNGSGNNPGGAVNGGSSVGGAAAANGGMPGAAGVGEGGAGEEPLPVYEQDDPNLIPEESDFQRVPIPVSVHNAMQ